MGIKEEIMEFLKEYKVIGLAVAFIIGAATNDLVKSLVDNVFMPLVGPLIPGGGWETATVALGPVVIRWGPFLSSLIYFIIIAIVVFLIAKKSAEGRKGWEEVAFPSSFCKSFYYCSV
ncbi:large conductance mechanosensitive channel protein MscL [Candidatus Micrarchaeota archaeon]|nr:large conductance mechanosensitive channel protein MscL [Candidatus Micrarchaeota archaeon]MBD3418325.1 large conductance mechanosensitive channel protein MscL [Candidatus Micrarchaeota archaeon]